MYTPPPFPLLPATISEIQGHKIKFCIGGRRAGGGWGGADLVAGYLALFLFTEAEFLDVIGRKKMPPTPEPVR